MQANCEQLGRRDRKIYEVHGTLWKNVIKKQFKAIREKARATRS